MAEAAPVAGEGLPHARLTLRRVLVVLIAVYSLLAVAEPDTVPVGLRVWALGNVTVLLAVVLLVRRARSHPAERSWLVQLALALGCFVVGGNAFLVLPATDDGTSPVASQVAFLALYPFLMAGTLLALRRHVRHARLIVALDGVAGAAAGAAVTTCFTGSLVGRLWHGESSNLVSLAFVVCDIALITMSLGALTVVGLARGRHFAVWALGMLVFGIGDIVYADRLAAGTYRVGTWVDSLWLVGLVLIALGATSRVRPEARVLPPAKTLGMVLLAPLAAIAVLFLAPDWRSDPLPSVLALAALAGGGTRFALAFLQVRELAEVREQALTDELTGVGNRRALYRRLDGLFGTDDDAGHRGDPPRFALALIDLDHFKEVNDSLGHGTGDELLRAVVERFAAALEEQGTPHLLTRLGGDEFAVVLDGTVTPDAAKAVGTALRESLAEPVALEHARLHVRASVGVSLAPEHGRCRSDLLFAADAAMYLAKSSVEGVCLYTPEEAGDRRNRLAVAEELYAALDRDELTVAYQPIESATGELVAAEALVRWDHPVRGRLSPADFLDTAERYQLTQRIARRVLDLTLADLARWRTELPHLTASVNISTSDLRDEGIVAVVAAALIDHGVPPEALTIEVTETAMMRDPSTAQSVLHALADLGVEVSIDDYGTGYSSLSYLLNLPIDEIKLDRAFCAGLLEQSRSAEIVRSTVELTHALGLRMVAEGIEVERQLGLLQDFGCDRVQGWHLGRPMAGEDFTRLVGDAAGERAGRTSQPRRGPGRGSGS